MLSGTVQVKVPAAGQLRPMGFQQKHQGVWRAGRKPSQLHTGLFESLFPLPFVASNATGNDVLPGGFPTL
jgi:hypothetical protein